ncbi:thermonuclease family protein [Carboxydothermus pertinax]|uniref:Thermonuclease n=1 Tax=Carboxydothermus pertinax TaxID=870242 RepID=A0A1L8CXA5_9THEO|nr:thermonuclease family protein [Carboxydothermus pertinax]GAV23565.1 thermonuclease [Carboxydothermus pertinax]
MNRRKVRALWFVLLIFAVIIQGCTGAVDASANFIQAKIVKVIDGDTIKVRFSSGKKVNIRLIGVNTPELSHPELGIKEQPYGKEAYKYTKKVLYPGRRVFLEYDVGKQDKYGRDLAYVWLEKPEKVSEGEIRAKMFNAWLLLEGYAQVMTVPPNVKYSKLFVKFQKEARENSRGLWK